ncbi:hypothetical protein GCM10008949_03210 [Deinococcus humi]|nr:hypothetical protein GCM10008949_03210 [Deinococcus humi]
MDGVDAVPVSTRPGVWEVRTSMTFGAALRSAREAQGLTLRELAQTTAIRRDYLQALEDGQLGGLPESTFARAYLRTYARELGLDPAPLLADFDRLIRPPAPEPEVTAPPQPAQEDVATLGPVRIALIAVLLVLLLAVGALLIRRSAPAALTPNAPTTQTTPPVQPQTPQSSALPPAVPKPVAPQGTVHLNVKSVPDGAMVYLDNRNLGRTPVQSFPVDPRSRAELRVEAAGRTPLKQTIDLGQSRNLRATLPPIGGETSVLTDLNTGVQTLTPLPPAPPPTTSAPAGAGGVAVRYVGQSWARVTDRGGRVLYEGVPAKGSVQNYPAGVSIRAGNAGAVRVTVGSGPEQAMGEAGQVLTRQY